MSISSHIKEFNKLISDILNLDETFKDECKAILLIGSLPNELDHLCIIIIHGKDKLSFKEVCYALLNYEIRKKDKKYYWDKSVKALTVRGRSQNKKWKKMGKLRPKSDWKKMSVPFVMRIGIGRKIILS